MKSTFKNLIILTFLPILLGSFATSTYEIAVLKYNGGGDWYANPTSLTNLISYCTNELSIDLNPDYAIVEAGSKDLFNYPFVHMTGHGNVEWNEDELANLRAWLNAGGFLHIDDNYGMDQYIRVQLEKLFPSNPLREIGVDYPIFHSPFDLPKGLPKVHQHDGGTPQAFGIFIENRLAVFYTFESDLGDGWEDPEVHNDPQSVRINALQMGANIVSYAFNGATYVKNN